MNELYELSSELEAKLIKINVSTDLISEIKEKYITDLFNRKKDMFNKKLINYFYRNYIFSLLQLYHNGDRYDNFYYKSLRKLLTEVKI